MTLGTVLQRVTQLRPHSYDRQELCCWLQEVEQMIFEEVIRPRTKGAQPPNPIDPQEDARVLQVPDPYGELYILYLISQIDLHRADAERYSFDAALFHAAYYQYAHVYARAHLPQGRVRVKA